MTNFGVNQFGIKKYQNGTNEDGIQLQYNGPTYSEIDQQLKESNPIVYNQIQMKSAQKSNPDSEIVKYKDSNGNIKTTTNVKGMPGSDPIASDILMGIVLGKPLGFIFNKSVQLGRKLFDKSNYTQDIINLLGIHKTPYGLKGERNSILTSLENYLQKHGVDTKQLSNLDLMKLMDLRRKSVLESAPDEKHVVSTQLGNYIEYELKKGDEILGTLNTTLQGDKFHVGSVYKYAGKGVSKDLYNSALYNNKQLGKPGLIAGENLQSPEQTLHIYNKYFPKHRIISYTGQHKYNNGYHVNKTGKPYTDNKGKVVDLKNPSEDQLPMKSLNIFHPNMIDKTKWILKTPNWNDKNIYKTIIPGLFIQRTQKSDD